MFFSFCFVLLPHRSGRSPCTPAALQVRKCVFLRHFILQTIILPRQARDKHRESTQNKDAFSCSCLPQSLPQHAGTWRSLTVPSTHCQHIFSRFFLSLLPRGTLSSRPCSAVSCLVLSCLVLSRLMLSPAAVSNHTVVATPRLIISGCCATTVLLVRSIYNRTLLPIGKRSVKKRHFLRCHFCIKCITLPRQTRDKHRESTQKRAAFP